MLICKKFDFGISVLIFNYICMKTLTITIKNIDIFHNIAYE